MWSQQAPFFEEAPLRTSAFRRGSDSQVSSTLCATYRSSGHDQLSREEAFLEPTDTSRSR
jgi:hypothetical protein